METIATAAMAIADVDGAIWEELDPALIAPSRASVTPVREYGEIFAQLAPLAPSITLGTVRGARLITIADGALCLEVVVCVWMAHLSLELPNAVLTWENGAANAPRMLAL